jgi:hypothetical protein
MDLDFVARAPRGSEVEELTQKAIVKCLRNKIPINQYLEMTGFESTGASRAPMEERGERREDRGPRREGGDRPASPPQAARPMPPPPPPPAPAAPLPPNLQRYFDLLGGLENSSKCLFLGADDAVVAEAPVKDMIDQLAVLEAPAKTVVFDGIVSQRLLDVAQEKGIETVIANRLGAIGKLPEQIRVLTRQDLAAPGAR